MYTCLLGMLKHVWHLDNSVHGKEVKEIVNLRFFSYLWSNEKIQNILAYKTMSCGPLWGSSMSHRGDTGLNLGSSPCFEF